MNKYGILNLTTASNPYALFDSIKRIYYDRQGILYKWIYNEIHERPLNAYEMTFISDCVHPSGIPVMLEKFLWSAKLLLSDRQWDDCDYFVRTNSSTFLNIELIKAEVERLPKRRCYAGPVMFSRFVSGTCIILSRDLVEYLVSRKIDNEKDCYDDLAISHLLRWKFVKKRDIRMKFFDDNRIHSIDEVGDALKEYPLIRIKNNADRQLYDFDIWRKIAQIEGISVSELSSI